MYITVHITTGNFTALKVAKLSADFLNDESLELVGWGQAGQNGLRDALVQQRRNCAWN